MYVDAGLINLLCIPGAMLWVWFGYQVSRVWVPLGWLVLAAPFVIRYLVYRLGPA